MDGSQIVSLVFQGALVLSAIVLMIATIGLKRSTDRYTEATKKMARSTERYAEVSEKSLRIEQFNFSEMLFRRFSPASAGELWDAVSADTIRKFIGEDTERLTNAYGKSTKGVLEDIEKGFSESDTE